MKFISPELEQYAHDHTRPRPPLFDELRSYTYDHVSWPQMQVGRIEGTLLKMLVALSGARRILEVGCYTGYSSLCMAEALPPDGRIITLDHSDEYTSVARTFFAKSVHGSKIEIRLGDGLETIRSFDEGDVFDMAFLDADKARYPDYFTEIVPRLRVGGLLVIDNVLWSGAVLDPQTDDAKGIATVNDMATEDPRVENVLLPVRDGVMLVRKL
jgi:caffeoyl-CoA O-methyltransferase